MRYCQSPHFRPTNIHSTWGKPPAGPSKDSPIANHISERVWSYNPSTWNNWSPAYCPKLLKVNMFVFWLCNIGSHIRSPGYLNTNKPFNDSQKLCCWGFVCSRIPCQVEQEHCQHAVVGVKVRVVKAPEGRVFVYGCDDVRRCNLVIMLHCPLRSSKLWMT